MTASPPTSPRQTPQPPAPGPDPKQHTSGQTSPELSDGPAPRLPHERDESADSQDDSHNNDPGDNQRQAHADVASGQVDTDRAAVMDQTYHGSVKPGAPPAPTPKR